MKSIKPGKTDLEPYPHEKIILAEAVELRYKNKLTLQQIADHFGVTKQSVHDRLKRFEALTGCPEENEQFDQVRDKMFSRIQLRYGLRLLDEKVVNKAGAKDSAVVMGVAFDKQRLERGLSTTNSAVIIAGAVLEADAQASKRELSTSCQHVDKSPQPQDIVVDRVDIEVEGVSG